MTSRSQNSRKAEITVYGAETILLKFSVMELSTSTLMVSEGREVSTDNAPLRRGSGVSAQLHRPPLTIDIPTSTSLFFDFENLGLLFK
jgi:hypothetical protein